MKMKPCPFCGGEAVLRMTVNGIAKKKKEKYVIDDPWETKEYVIKCTNCHATVESMYFVSEAVDKWNRRVKE